jgi:hypothetical protein
MHVLCEPTVIESGDFIDIPLHFVPREQKEYAFVLPFIVNGNSKVDVQVKGEGVLPRLELTSPSQSVVHLGNVKVNREIKREVGITNRSKCPITFHFIDEQLMGRGILE